MSNKVSEKVEVGYRETYRGWSITRMKGPWLVQEERGHGQPLNEKMTLEEIRAAIDTSIELNPEVETLINRDMFADEYESLTVFEELQLDTNVAIASIAEGDVVNHWILVMLESDTYCTIDETNYEWMAKAARKFACNKK